MEEYKKRIVNAIRYIDGHPDAELTLEAVSEAAAYSPFHFHRIFRLITGETVQNYIIRRRIERCAFYLASRKNKKTFKNIDYWISYSFLDSKRDFMNYPFSLKPGFASEHTLSAVAKKFVTSWKSGFNLSYTYAKDRPYYDIATKDVNGQPEYYQE